MTINYLIEKFAFHNVSININFSSKDGVFFVRFERIYFLNNTRKKLVHKNVSYGF